MYICILACVYHIQTVYVYGVCYHCVMYVGGSARSLSPLCCVAATAAVLGAPNRVLCLLL